MVTATVTVTVTVTVNATGNVTMTVTVTITICMTITEAASIIVKVSRPIDPVDLEACTQFVTMRANVHVVGIVCM